MTRTCTDHDGFSLVRVKTKPVGVQPAMYRPEAVVDDVDSADAFKSDIKLSIIRVLGMMYLTKLSNDMAIGDVYSLG